MKKYEQLDLLNYIPEPVENPLPPPLPPPSMAEIWWESKADYYLMLMSRFMMGDRCSSKVRQHEILRLYRLRAAAQLQAERIRGRDTQESELLFTEGVVNDEK